MRESMARRRGRRSTILTGTGLTSNPDIDNKTLLGAIVGYAGGGYGGHATTQAIQTSLYGGGSGCNTSTVATAGTANTGGGGGGGANQNLNGGSGRSSIS